MTVRCPTRHYSLILHSPMQPPRRLAVVPPSRRDLAAVLLPLHLDIMTVASWVHGGPLALPAPPPPGQVNDSGASRHSANEIDRVVTTVLLHLHLGIMTLTGRVHGGPLALPVELSSRDLTAVLLLMHLVLMVVTRRVHNGPLALPAPTPTGPGNGNVATQVMITMIKRLVEVTMTSSPKITNTSGTSTIDDTEWP